MRKRIRGSQQNMLVLRLAEELGVEPETVMAAALFEFSFLAEKKRREVMSEYFLNLSEEACVEGQKSLEEMLSVG